MPPSQITLPPDAWSSATMQMSCLLLLLLAVASMQAATTKDPTDRSACCYTVIVSGFPEAQFNGKYEQAGGGYGHVDNDNYITYSYWMKPSVWRMKTPDNNAAYMTGDTSISCLEDMLF